MYEVGHYAPPPPYFTGPHTLTLVLGNIDQKRLKTGPSSIPEESHGASAASLICLMRSSKSTTPVEHNQRNRVIPGVV